MLFVCTCNTSISHSLNSIYVELKHSWFLHCNMIEIETPYQDDFMNQLLIKLINMAILW